MPTIKTAPEIVRVAEVLTGCLNHGDRYKAEHEARDIVSYMRSIVKSHRTAGEPCSLNLDDLLAELDRRVK
jgi:hypothetical protein